MADYKAVLSSLGKAGDFKDGVLKVTFLGMTSRHDCQAARSAPFGFGGWIAMTKGDAGSDVMMGIVLQEDEVNPVMSAVLAGGLE